MARAPGESRHGVGLTNLDQPLFTGAEATKRDLIDYLESVAEPILAELRGRPLSVVRVRPGQKPFMQKNLPSYAPDFIRWVPVWSQAGNRKIHYPICDDLRTLLWFGNQRAVEYHPTLVELSADGRQAGPVTRLVIDLDPPEDGSFEAVAGAARLVRSALAETGLSAAVKTSGAKGAHVVVPVHDLDLPDAAAAVRALTARAERLDPRLATTAFLKADRGGRVFLDPTRVGAASLACAFSPRVRPGATVSWPVPWDELDDVVPADFTLRTAPSLLGSEDPWLAIFPAPQRIPEDLIAEGNAIPAPRVLAMHEGKRRKRAAENPPEPDL